MFFFDFFSNLVFYTILLVYIWTFFLRGNFLSIRLLFNQTTKLTNNNVIRHQTNLYFNNYSCVIIFYLILSFFLERGDEGVFFFQHCYFSNSNTYLLLIASLFLMYMYLVLRNTPVCNTIINNDYFFSLLNISVVIPLLYYVNTFYSFFFVLELVSVLIFYKFVVSKFWVKQKTMSIQKNKILEKIFSRSYTNVLFFQYWVNFFSSVIILFSVINIVSIYGSSEWFFLNFLNMLNKENYALNDFEYNFIFWVPLFFSLFLKIGLTPAHLFKIEVYKGIPFISIFFYTTYYFLVYFIIFILFLKNYLSSFANVWWFFFLVFIVVGIFYTISLLFDVVFTKAFFAYSTIINSLGFFILLVSSI